MQLFLKDNEVNREEVLVLAKKFLSHLNDSVTPENIRTRLKWNLSNKVFRGSEDGTVEIEFCATTKEEQISGFMRYITTPANGSRRFDLNTNPAVIKIKNRTEALLDESIDNKPKFSKTLRSILEKELFATYEVMVEFTDPEKEISEMVNIKLIVTLQERS